MNKVSGIDGDRLLRTADLAARGEFRLGEALVNPGTRSIQGPGGQADLEPRVMQVLVVLADAAGQVVTRETLFQRCWGNVFVGDDSLNRAVAGVRKVAEKVAAGSFTVETVPRTGYQLIVRRGANTGQPVPEKVASRSLSRRALIGGAVAAIATGGLGVRWATERASERQLFTQLMERGEQEVNYVDPAVDPSPHFQEAVAIRPDDAKAQGLLAYSLSTGSRGPGEAEGAGKTPLDVERAAQKALELDPNEPHARLALALLQRPLLDLAASEDRFRAILSTSPANIIVMRHLWGLLQSAGRSRDAFALVERALAIEPFAAGNHYPLAQMLWILGRNAEADRVIDRAIGLWPSHRFVRFARFTILAFTNRPRAALAMLKDETTRPQLYTPQAVALWKVSLAALEERTSPTVAAARDANLAAARETPQLANQAVMALSALGEVDAAFEAADRLLLFRAANGKQANGSSQRAAAGSTAWRFTPWLFTPPVAAMRADLRFKILCDEIGLTDYWNKRRIKPDYQLGIT